jgi:hypothetical protein
MINNEEYNPLKWPPDLQLADIHMKCVCPGSDDIEGFRCPCCDRWQKVKISHWFKRNINKDFKKYGSGIPSYFELLKYLAFMLLILVSIMVTFHIYVLEITCPRVRPYCDTMGLDF